MSIMPQTLARIAGVPFMENPQEGKPSAIEALLAGPSLYDMFFDACEVDYRRAVSCASIRPSRTKPALPPTGCQRFVIGDGHSRVSQASELRYHLSLGGLELDIFKQAIRRVNTFFAGISLEDNGERISAYTINFG
ncbi:MAG: hypothetical protein JWN26_287 [Candidatus Saccharibacteria bacterium]|nr:hypothetical protein [Candidatus Saccharibacteria bacterium]